MKGMEMIGKGIVGLALCLVFFSFSSFAQNEADTTQTRNPEFITNAEQLVQDLTPRLSLTDQQAREIKEILVDYQQNISGAKADSAETGETTDESQNDVNDRSADTLMQDKNETQTDTSQMDMNSSDIHTDIEHNNDVDQSGVTPDATNDPREIANKAIENVLNDTQKTTWAVIRDAWWRDVNTRYGFDKQGDMK